MVLRLFSDREEIFDMDFEQIANRIRTQDNRGTSDPLFCVYEHERIYGVDPEYHHDVEIVNIWNDEGDIMTRVAYIERKTFVNAHFTQSSAQKYIDENSHNLTKPFVYVSSMYRCPEMIAIRKWLAGGGEGRGGGGET